MQDIFLCVVRIQLKVFLPMEVIFPIGVCNPLAKWGLGGVEAEVRFADVQVVLEIPYLV